jgi:hypothetical protein
MKKIVLSLMLTLAVVGSAATATYAYFTSQTSVLGNTVTAAILKIRTGQATTKMELSGLAPGFWTAPHAVRIFNDNAAGSNIAATLKASAVRTGNLDMFNNLYLVVRNENDSVTFFDGWLRDFTDTSLTNALIQPGDWDDFKFYLKLNPEVGNNYQGLTTGFNLVFTATQQMP